jgi:uncharacterized damage-inducible protein DinB
MRRFAYLFFFLLLSLGTLAQGQQKPAEKPAPTPTTPTAGARLEFLDEVSYYEQRFERLAEAVPAEKYTWRPGEGVRSIGEVYMHIAVANYNIARALGTPPPAGFDAKALMASSGDKAKVTQALKDSFTHFRSVILLIKDSDMDNAQKMFGHQTTVRGAFILITGHFGEHLGQSIAYARQNGIVPPWTEEHMRQEAEKPKS